MSSRAWLLLLAATAFAQDPRQILEESQKRVRSKSERYQGTLEMLDAKGKTRAWRWTFERIGSFGDSKSMLRFLAPPEVKGVALLIVNHPNSASEQWLWTPAIDRERRVALQDRSGRFFGTDFSFEDLEERDISQFDYSAAGTETVDSAPCWKIESHPKQSKSSQYTSSRLWVRKDNYVLAKIENYSQEKLVRTIHYRDIRKTDNLWTPQSIEVEDPARKSRTVLKLEKLEYNVPMKPEDFTVEAMRKGA